MQLIDPQVLNESFKELEEIDQLNKSIYRLIVFNEDHRGSDLLKRFLEAVEHLRDVLSIKNAQQESQSFTEAKEYLSSLKSCLAMIVHEISLGNKMVRPTDVFHLLRLISPETSERHSNHYRKTNVQFGPCFGADPIDIERLIDQLFYYLSLIKHPVCRAIYFHHEVVRIHPFIDGNGRLARMGQNWLLMYELYPPIFIGNYLDKKEYIIKLQKSFLDIEKKPFSFHSSTLSFFEDELKRIRASIQFILNRMLNNPDLEFEENLSI